MWSVEGKEEQRTPPPPRETLSIESLLMSVFCGTVLLV